MPPFPKPRSSFDYDLDAELAALRAHRKLRQMPARGEGRLLLATWNIANFGVQERREKDHRLRAVQELLPKRYRLLISDTAGNDERTAFIYDSRKVKLLELTGRLSIPVSAQRHIKLQGVEREFRGFDRSPFLGSFQVGDFRFLLASVHLYFGSDDTADLERRALEAYAVGRWADLRRDDEHAYVPDIIALGDFNLPAVDRDDPVYKALTKRGLALPEHGTEVGGSSLGGHHHYDQMAFFRLY